MCTIIHPLHAKGTSMMKVPSVRKPPVLTVSFRCAHTVPFLRCFLAPRTNRVNTRCSTPPGAPFVLRVSIREELCGPNSNPSQNHPPVRQPQVHHLRSFHSGRLPLHASEARIPAVPLGSA